MGSPFSPPPLAIDPKTEGDMLAPIDAWRHNQPAQRVTGLAIAVTDRSDLGCRYRRDDVIPLPREELLTIEEIDRIVTTFVDLGVRRIRLTGGEPLVRRGIGTLVRILCRHLAAGAAEAVILATNGNRLAAVADALAAGGLRQVDVWLDTRDEDRFRHLSEGGDLAAVLAGITHAKQAGLAIRINTVVLPGVNDDEFDALIQWCGDEGFDLSLLEPPLALAGGYPTMQRLRARLARRWTLQETGPIPTGAGLLSMNRRFRVAETAGRLRLVTRPPGSSGYARLTAIGQFSWTARLRSREPDPRRDPPPRDGRAANRGGGDLRG
jgi:cyclic pyranopterin phosphate synthase